jgi:hypothetical protein
VKIRTAAAATLAVALAVPGVANAAAKKPAAPKPLVFTDLAGDANALDPGLGAGPSGGTATPGQVDAFDIREVKIVTDKAGSAATKVLVSLKLAAAPTIGIYRVVGDIGGCEFWTEQSINPDASLNGAAVRTCDDGTTGYAYTDVSAKIDGSTITWTIPVKAFKAAGLKAGAVWGGLGADARGNEVALTAPSVDRAETDAVYKVGS